MRRLYSTHSGKYNSKTFIVIEKFNIQVNKEKTQKRFLYYRYRICNHERTQKLRPSYL